MSRLRGLSHFGLPSVLGGLEARYRCGAVPFHVLGSVPIARGRKLWLHPSYGMRNGGKWHQAGSAAEGTPASAVHLPVPL